MFQRLRVTVGPLLIGVLGLSGLMMLPHAAWAEDIVLGQVGPFTVIPVPDAVEVNQGIKAYIAQVNKGGGIQGRKLSLFELDDRYGAGVVRITSALVTVG